MMLFAAALESPGGRRAAACCVICKDAEHLVARGAGLLCVRFLRSWRQHRPSSRSAPVEALTSGQVRAAGDGPTTDGVDRSEHARPCCIEHRGRRGARVSDPVLPRAFRRRQYRPAFRERSTAAFRKPSRFEHPSLRSEFGRRPPDGGGQDFTNLVPDIARLSLRPANDLENYSVASSRCH